MFYMHCDDPVHVKTHSASGPSFCPEGQTLSLFKNQLYCYIICNNKCTYFKCTVSMNFGKYSQHNNQAIKSYHSSKNVLESHCSQSPPFPCPRQLCSPFCLYRLVFPVLEFHINESYSRIQLVLIFANSFFLAKKPVWHSGIKRLLKLDKLRTEFVHPPT